MDVKTLWDTVLSELELTVSRGVFQTVFTRTSLVSLENGVATVGIPNPMVRGMIETRYYSLIKNILDQHTKENISIVFTLTPKKEVFSHKDAGPLFSEDKPGISQADIVKRFRLRTDSTFEQFAVSPSNQLAFAAATAVSRTPGTAYNPLFFYGGVGVGKTHLMQAVANELLKKRPTLKVVYCMGDEFLNEIVDAIQSKTARKFKQKYRSAQLLLVDDVQFIAGKQTAQEEFFHTFNAVHREGGQIILTSDRPPSDISKLEDRLRSRFEGGLIVDVAPPDFELRVAIINIKAKLLSLDIPSDAAQLAAANITDTRAVEGFLRKLHNETMMNRVPITTTLVADLLHVKPDDAGGLPKEKLRQKPRVTPLEVLEAVSSYYNLNTKHLKGPKRDRPLARPRQLIMYICKTELNVTLQDIGGLLGGRDHTTIMHGVDKITKELSVDASLQEALSSVRTHLFVKNNPQ